MSGVTIKETYSFITPHGTICGDGFSQFTTLGEAMSHQRYRGDCLKHDVSQWKLYKTTTTTSVRREMVR
jgi:hypothetical protein